MVGNDRLQDIIHVDAIFREDLCECHVLGVAGCGYGITSTHVEDIRCVTFTFADSFGFSNSLWLYVGACGPTGLRLRLGLQLFVLAGSLGLRTP